MANSTDPDQFASSEANCSGSALFSKAGYIRVQQDKGYAVLRFRVITINMLRTPHTDQNQYLQIKQI